MIIYSLEKPVFDISRLSIERLLHPTSRKMQQTFVLRFKNLIQGSKTCAIRLQKLTPKGSKLAAKVCTAYSKKFFLHTKKFVLHTKKISFVVQKNSICTAKIAISTFSHTLGILLSL